MPNSIKPIIGSNAKNFKKTIKYYIYGTTLKEDTMENGRNTLGRFTKGHGGFKPKGAISKKKQKQTSVREQVLEMAWQYIAESVPELSPRQRVRLFMGLLRTIAPKLKRIPSLPVQAIQSAGEVKN